MGIMIEDTLLDLKFEINLMRNLCNYEGFKVFLFFLGDFGMECL